MVVNSCALTQSDHIIVTVARDTPSVSRTLKAVKVEYPFNKTHLLLF